MSVAASPARVAPRLHCGAGLRRKARGLARTLDFPREDAPPVAWRRDPTSRRRRGRAGRGPIPSIAPNASAIPMPGSYAGAARSSRVNSVSGNVAVSSAMAVPTDASSRTRATGSTCAPGGLPIAMCGAAATRRGRRTTSLRPNHDPRRQSRRARRWGRRARLDVLGELDGRESLQQREERAPEQSRLLAGDHRNVLGSRRRPAAVTAAAGAPRRCCCARRISTIASRARGWRLGPGNRLTPRTRFARIAGEQIGHFRVIERVVGDAAA